MKFTTFAVLFCAAVLLFPFHSTKAMDCYVDPVREYTGTGKISSAVFMRDNACVQGTNILMTLSVNAAVNVVGFTDGWYYVEYNSNRGWIGSQFLGGTSFSASEKVWSSYQEFMQAYPSHKAAATVTPTPLVTPAVKTDPVLVSRFLGYILLDVQSRGEAWYLNPTDSHRYYMKDGAVAYEMMRSFGLGMSFHP